MNDPEKGMWKYQAGIFDQKSNLLQVKNLSRYLEICAQKRKYSSLSDQQIQKVVMRENQEIHHHLVEALTLC